MTFQEEPPAEYGTHLYWLWGWGQRLEKHLETHKPGACSSSYYQPDNEAAKALIHYSSVHPYLVDTIERFRAKCEDCQVIFLERPTDDNFHVFAQALDQLRRRISQAVDGIASDRAAKGEFSKEFHHNDDFSIVVWKGLTYKFTSTQAACVKVLWKHWENDGPGLRKEHILEEAGSKSNRLRDVFRLNGKTNPFWTDAIESLGSGIYSLKK